MARDKGRMTGMFYHVVLLPLMPPVADIVVCDFGAPGDR
jgi:hypothetical protein